MKGLTSGIHHVGLSVSKLEESAQFFTELLGWQEVKRDMNYPAIFVSDGSIMLTLWSVKSDSSIKFDRKNNVGLHHLALSVESEDILITIYKRLLNAGTLIEFSPEPLQIGPSIHMMCYDPSGIRVEFIWTCHQS
ncbi:VOC family protein [Aliivibrio salmonicida]|uniref:VOC family protein n=1 Tax=Aliivibrio salmonicida TaxID=40269 RepID=UPI00406C7103